MCVYVRAVLERGRGGEREKERSGSSFPLPAAPTGTCGRGRVRAGKGGKKKPPYPRECKEEKKKRVNDDRESFATAPKTIER